MIILFKHLFKNIYENKFRSIAIIFIVALSTTVSVIALSLNDIVKKTYEKVYNASVGEANITIESENAFEKDSLNLQGITIDKQEDIYDLSGKFSYDNTVIRAAIRGIDVEQYLDMGSLSIMNDTNDFTLNSQECIISVKSSEKYGLNVGSKCIVTIHDKNYAFTVKAIGESNRTFYEEQGNIQILIPLGDCNLLEGTKGYATKVRLKTSMPTVEVVKILKNQNPGYNIYEGEEFENLHFQLQSVSSAMLITMCIVILVGGYIISSLVKIIMADRIPVIGTFRSVGTDQKKVVSIALLEFVAYGVIGTLLGLLFGVIGLPLVADLFNQYKEYGVKTVVDYNGVYLIIAALIGILLPPVMAFTKVVSVSKIDLKEIILQLNVEHEVRSNKGIIASLITLPLCLITYLLNRSDSFILGLLTNGLLIVGGTFFVQVLLSYVSKFLGRRVKRNGSTMLGIKSLRNNRYVRNNSSMIVTISLIFIVIITIIDGIRHTAQNDLESYGFDIIAIINDEKNVGEKDMEKFEGVSGAFESYETMAFGNYANGYCRVYGIEDFDHLNQYMEALNYSDSGEVLDQKLASAKNGIVIDQYWARVRNIKIGDKIKLFYDDKKKSEAGDFTVVDTWDCSKGTTDRVFVGISLDNYKKIFENIPERILIKTNMDSKDVADKIAATYIDTDISVQTTMDYLQEQINTVDTILNILIISIVMSGIVIVIGISSNLIVSFLKRKKEYATLYSVCMDMSQLKSMIRWETITSYVAISITILLLYVPIVTCIPKLTNGVGLVIHYNAKPLIIAGVLVVTFIMLLLTTIGPNKELKKINIVEELKYE